MYRHIVQTYPVFQGDDAGLLPGIVVLAAVDLFLELLQLLVQLEVLLVALGLPGEVRLARLRPVDERLRHPRTERLEPGVGLVGEEAQEPGDADERQEDEEDEAGERPGYHGQRRRDPE